MLDGACAAAGTVLEPVVGNRAAACRRAVRTRHERPAQRPTRGITEQRRAHASVKFFTYLFYACAIYARGERQDGPRHQKRNDHHHDGEFDQAESGTAPRAVHGAATIRTVSLNTGPTKPTANVASPGVALSPSR